MGSWHDIRLKFPLPWKNKITILRNDLEYNLMLKFNSNAPIIGHPLGGLGLGGRGGARSREGTLQRVQPNIPISL